MKLKIGYLISFILIRIIGIFSKINKGQVLFLSETRNELGGNLEKMNEIVSAEKYNKKYYLKDKTKLKITIKDKIKMYKLISTSEYILLDDFCTVISFMRLKKNQQVIQLWHGPGAYKKFGLSRQDKNPGKLKRFLTHRNYTNAIVTSEDVRWCYAEGFGMPKEKVLATGYPRTDIFLIINILKKLKKNYTKNILILKTKRLLLLHPHIEVFH